MEREVARGMNEARAAEYEAVSIEADRGQEGSRRSTYRGNR